MKVLLVVATEPEAAPLRALPARVVVSGIGDVNAALATQAAIWQERPELILSVGIGGAYPGSGLQPGDVALASEMVYAQLGAMDGDQFLDLKAMGFPVLPGNYGRFPAWKGTSLDLPTGPFLTVLTVTGSAEGAAALERRHPGALIEGMEGAGVAHAAALAGLPAGELRGVSNLVGPRDRASWQIGPALGAMRGALERLLNALS